MVFKGVFFIIYFFFIWRYIVEKGMLFFWYKLGNSVYDSDIKCKFKGLCLGKKILIVL